VSDERKPLSDQSESVLRTALEKIRLHGSPMWQTKWGTPSGLANAALNDADMLDADDMEAAR
jgi:hypothetical protein